MVGGHHSQKPFASHRCILCKEAAEFKTCPGIHAYFLPPFERLRSVKSCTSLAEGIRISDTKWNRTISEMSKSTSDAEHSLKELGHGIPLQFFALSKLDKSVE